jgi:hypothetical protein
MQKLPLGKQNFKDIIEGNFIYVDKTNWILQLLEKDVPYFLSRPRRFGKTLTVSTLFHLFKGRKELFKDTYIYDKWDFVERPVIRLDMSRVNSIEGIEFLKKQLSKVTLEQAEANNIQIESKVYSDAFKELVKKLDSPALLIDEYDKLILNNLHKPDYVDQIREVLREYYGTIKSHESEFSFIFLTGISKFSKMSIFSELNNLTDLTLRIGYTDMLGLSDEEIAVNFRDYIEKVKDEQNMSEDEFWERLRDYYNGFSFDGEHFLYNPYSILNFFDTGEFRNYWFESGTPSHIIELIKNQMLKSTDFSEKRVRMDFTSRRPIESTTPESFLFQAGYLTIKDSQKNKYYILDFPNNEVRSSFNSLFLDSIWEVDNATDVQYNIEEALENNQFDLMFKQFQNIFSKIPYNLFDSKESYYHSIILTLLWSLGIKTTAEDMSNLGRSDIVIEFGDDIYILELKRDSAEKALQQIKDKEYYKKFTGQDKNIHLVGIEIDDEQRNFVDYHLEKLK